MIANITTANIMTAALFQSLRYRRRIIPSNEILGKKCGYAAASFRRIRAVYTDCAGSRFYGINSREFSKHLRVIPPVTSV
jgi:hypothetical protein